MNERTTVLLRRIRDEMCAEFSERSIDGFIAFIKAEARKSDIHRLLVDRQEGAAGPLQHPVGR